MELSKKVYLSLFVLIMALFLASYFKLLAIRNLEIVALNPDCVNSKQLRAEVKVVGKNIWEIDKTKVSSEIQQRYPCVKDLSINYQPLNTLKIEVEDRTAIARVVGYAESSTLTHQAEASPSSAAATLDWNFIVSSPSGWIIDEEGVIFGNSDNIYPILLYPENLLVNGGGINPDVAQKLSYLLTRLTDLGVNFTHLKLDGGLILIDSKPRVVMDSTSDFPKQIASLQLILNKSKIDSMEAESIDLRFNKPVVIYTSKKKS
jgi:cell division septal protein FtsQ